MPRIKKATDAAVKIRECLLKEEKEKKGQHVLKGAEYLDSIPRKDLGRVLRAYQELFSRNCPADIGMLFVMMMISKKLMEQTGELWGT